MAWLEHIFNRTFREVEDSIQITTNPFITQSKANEYTGGLTQRALITPPSGKRLDIKGVTLCSNGSGGTIYLRRGNGVPSDPEINTDVVLLLCVSVRNQSSASSNLNVLLDVDETLDLEIDGVTKDSFVGVSYRLV